LDCREQTGAAPARISRAQENAVDYHDRGYDEVRPPTVARSRLRTSPSQASRSANTSGTHGGPCQATLAPV